MKNIVLIFSSIIFNSSLFAQQEIVENLTKFNNDGEPSQTVLDFDGIDDYVEIDNVAGALEGLTSYTIEFWMKADLNDQTSSIRSAIFSINPITANGNGLLIIMGGLNAQDGKILIYDENTWGTNAEIVSSQVVGDNNCHHIAYSRNNGTATLYIDGVQSGTHSTAYTISSSDKISLGQEWDNLNSTPSTSQFYNGVLSDVRIWDSAKNASDIQNNMNTVLTGNEPGLLAYYKCNQGVADGYNPTVDYLTDSAPIGLIGSLVNFTLSGLNSNWVSKTCQPLNIREIEERISVDVFPNPVEDLLYLDFKSTIINEGEYEVYDCTGKLVDFGQVSPYSAIDFSTQPSGLYILKLSIDDKTDYLKIQRK